jgi:dihydrodipicolinate synthase/N-acetylneuraminate lyase
MKWLLHELGEFASPAVRPPLAPLSDDERSLVRAAAAAAGLERDVIAS